MTREKVLVVLYPYKFSEFLWESLELSELSKYIRIEVWDLSLLINRQFSNGIFTIPIERENIKQFKNFNQFFRYLFSFKKMNFMSESYFINEIPLASIKSILLYRIILYKIEGKKILEFLNPGIPTNYTSITSQNRKITIKLNYMYKTSSTIREIIKRITLIISYKIGASLTKTNTFKLIAGAEWLTQESMRNSKKNIKVILGHSQDISKCIKINSLSHSKYQEFGITHLDAAGPMYETDSLLLGRKNYLTIDNWYPQLCNFFKVLEQRLKAPVTIAGHYKSGFSSPSPVFANRNVRYGETYELISTSSLVTTRYSTATSIAVYLGKPIIFIYSNELKEDLEAMKHIFRFAKLLDSKTVNIDEITNKTEFELTINEGAYRSYFENYLSSGNPNIPNYQIILSNFLSVPDCAS